MLTFPQLKKAIENTMNSYGISEDQAKIRLFGLDDSTLLAVASGDLSAIGSQGDSDHGTAEKITPEKISEGNAETITEDTSDKITETQNAIKRTKKPRATKDTTVKAPIDDIYTITDIDDTQHLPPQVPDMVYSFIEMWCKNENIDDMRKERQTVWKALCMAIGRNVFRKNRKLLAGTPPKNGGFCYDFNKIYELAEIWIYMCGKYTKAPMIDDFAYFTGIEESTLYANGGDYTEGHLTPERLRLLKKLRSAQETGLAGMIADGRQNPTGALACLNHWHGWTSTKEIIHTTSNGAQNAVALPVFDNSISSLPDNSTKS